MITPPSFDFEKLVPGFEFLKNMGNSQSAGGLSSAASWVAPTLDPKELDRKIQELKTVQFWLDQNAKAIGATIQALEVQKMTLSTLRGMNFNMSDLSESLKANVNAWASTDGDLNKESRSTKSGKRNYSFTNSDKKENDVKSSSSSDAGKSKHNDSKIPTGIDPTVWWNSLGEQFQHIAQKTVQEMQKHAQNNQHLHAQEESKRRTTERQPSQNKKPVKAAKRTAAKTASQRVTRKTT